MYPKSRTSRVFVFDRKREKKLSVGIGWRDAERILASYEILIILRWGQTGEVPLVPFVVVIVGPGTEGLIDLCKAGAAGQIDLILHVSEEALLRGIVPAVGPTGHGLAELGVRSEVRPVTFPLCVLHPLETRRPESSAAAIISFLISHLTRFVSRPAAILS